ncbi:MAG: heparinase II/III family protein [Candidatus Hydrogenedentes bacterium]|nr:heparinase II/III family protein [Candidatus Hydrogenedentota bacterium]
MKHVMARSCVFVLAAFVCAAQPLLKPTPINVAEAIIEPFWEPALSGLPEWRIDDGASHHLQVRQTWASVEFQWATKPAQGPALRMTREFNVDCSGYDRLLVAMTAPEDTVVHIQVATDTGERSTCAPPSQQVAAEYSVDLAGVLRIDAITLEIESGREGPGAGCFKWIGLQSTTLLPHYLAEHDFSHLRWEAQLKDESFEPAFTPRYGIFLTSEELANLRARHENILKQTGSSPWADRAGGLRGMQPEHGIHEFVGSGGRENEPHARVRDAELPAMGSGVAAAEAGLVLRDKALLSIAARCALSLAVSEKWDEGFLDRFPGSPWELRSFRRGYTCDDIATILDLAGEMFTETGRTYLLRRLAEEGIGPANYITWRYDYIYHGNQMTFFGKGRLFAYLVMEREWPRTKPYTDLALRDLAALFENLIMSDGGFMEPPTYATGTVRSGCEMFEYYARARQVELASVVPKRVVRTGDFAAAVASTVGGADVIPFGDSGTKLGTDALITLASLAPDSSWLTLLRKRLEGVDESSLSFHQRQKLDKLPTGAPSFPAFVLLPETGLAASTREFDGELLKIFVRGNHGTRFHSHEHEDTGSFVVEFAGETFAMDPGITEYEDPRHQLMKRADWHNMLVPSVDGERPGPAAQIAVNVTPRAKGNHKSFQAKLDVTPAWTGVYRRWIRTWDSPAPDRLILRDDYELAQGHAVEFCWQTPLPCSIEDGTVVIRGTRGQAKLQADAGCAVRIDDLPVIGDVQQKRIVFRKEGDKGTIKISVEFSGRHP